MNFQKWRSHQINDKNSLNEGGFNLKLPFFYSLIFQNHSARLCYICYLIVVIAIVKKLFLILFFFISNVAFSIGQSDSIFNELVKSIQNKKQYELVKRKKIASLKKILSGDLSLKQEYDCNIKLYQEYRKFKLDSAIYYIKKNTRIAAALKDKNLEDLSKLQLANLFSSSGRYRESEEILKAINKNKLSKSFQSFYYEVYSQFFEHYATNNYNPNYAKFIGIYRDSLLSVLDQNAIKYKINLAQEDLNNKRVDVAQKNLLQLLKNSKTKDQDYAMTAYLLGDTYRHKNDLETAKKYYLISATTDIKNAIKDNASVQNLALIYYEKGDVDTAFLFTKSAIEDAIFCNVKFRTVQMSEFYSIINTAYLAKEADRKSQLKFYLILISILSFFLILAIIYVYKQMKKVSKIKEELDATGQKLSELNQQIIQTNHELENRNSQLSESNHIKEEYIAHFFDLCSTYINKLENYRKALNKKATEKQLDDLFKMLKSNTIVETELEELYLNFDTIFLNLYPTFVKDFNSLLIKEEQITVKQGELLNTELRIFALIRLGINDSVKIAAFLRYSLSTIYNYRTKARNKAAVSRDEFEILVSKIGNLTSKTSF
jgi:predicted Holliday junction resolvase-like endonuclease